MQIVFVNINLAIGGAEKHLLTLLHNWPRPEDQLELILFDARGEWLKEVPSNVKIRKLKAARPDSAALKLWWAIKIILELRDYFKHYKPERCFTFLWPATVLCVLARLSLTPKPLLVWSVQSDLKRNLFARAFGWFKFKAIAALIRRGVDLFVVPSAPLAHSLSTDLKLESSRVIVVPNAVSLPSSLLADPGAALPWGSGLRIISVGRLHPAKNYGLLLHALKGARERGLNFSCLIVGGGEQLNQLELLREQLDLESFVQFLGARNDAAALLSSAQLFVSSSNWETFGVAIAEALLSGLPVVATATDGAKDMIVPGRNGMLVPPGDAEAMAEAICWISIALERHLWSGKSRDALAAELSPSRVASRYAETMIAVGA